MKKNTEVIHRSHYSHESDCAYWAWEKAQQMEQFGIEVISIVPFSDSISVYGRATPDVIKYFVDNEDQVEE